MRAALYQGQGKIELTQLPDPVCTPDGAILQTVYASICGTDVAVYKHGTGLGHRITIGGEFGHEAFCVVKETGENVKDLKPGDRVYPYPRLVTGDPKRSGTIGGFSEYIKAPLCRLCQEVYKVPDGISDRCAALIEPFTVGCRAARRASVRRDESAIVFGAGTIGIAAAIALKYFGCRKVMICDHSDLRLGIAEKLGFQICNNGREDLAEAAISYFGTGYGYKGETADVDIMIDAAGADPIVDFYQEHGRIDSRMVMVAVGTNVRPIDVLGMTFGQLALIGSGGYNPEDVRDVMDIMESGKWDIESLITHEYPWEKLDEAIEMAGRTDQALNVVIHF
jgi:(R,R)-butanediol dehydrogenase/meso-butanediol dehydrogenase/diacetyl reductase